MGSFGETVGEIWRQEEKVSLRVYAYGTSPVVDSFARVIDATCKSIYIRPFLVIKHRSHRLVSIPFSSLTRERERQNNNQKNSSKKKRNDRTNELSIDRHTNARDTARRAKERNKERKSAERDDDGERSRGVDGRRCVDDDEWGGTSRVLQGEDRTARGCVAR